MIFGKAGQLPAKRLGPARRVIRLSRLRLGPTRTTKGEIMGAFLDRLRQIANEIRVLHNAFPKGKFPWDVSSDAGEEDRGLDVQAMDRMGGILLDEAIAKGAFAGPEHKTFQLYCGNEKKRYPDSWEGRIFFAAMTYFMPALLEGQTGREFSWDEIHASIADALEADIQRMEASASMSPAAKTGESEGNGVTGDHQDFAQAPMIVTHFHDNSVNIHGNVQGSNVAAGGSNILGSSASYNNSEELVDALKALIPLIRTEVTSREDEIKDAIDFLVRAVGDPSIPATEVEQAASLVVSSSPTLKQRLGDIVGRIGISLTGSAIFQGIKTALGIP